MARIAVVGRVDGLARHLAEAGHEPLPDPAPGDAVRASELSVVQVDRVRAWRAALHRAGSRLPVLAVAEDPAAARLAIAAGADDVIRLDDPPEVQLARIRLHLEGVRRRRKQVIQRAREAEARAAATELATQVHDLRAALAGLLGLLRVGVLTLDPTLRVLSANPAVSSILGFPVEPDHESLHLADLLLRPEEADRIAATINEAVDRRVEAMRIVLRGRGGEAVPARASAILLPDPAGIPATLLLVLEDIRQEEALQQRLDETSRRLVAEISAARRSRETLQATSHELNQPLTSVMAMLELLRLDKGLDPGIADRLDRAYAQLERMADSVRAMMSPRSP